MLQRTILVLVFLSLGFSGLFAQTEYSFPDGVNHALSLANKNKGELVKVLEYYSQTQKDSLKFKAACVLIANLPFHSYKNNYEDYNSLIDFLAKQRKVQNEEGIEEKKIRDYTRKTFEKASASVYRSNINREHLSIKDLDTVNSQFLIENIELAFSAHEKLPAEYQSSFEDFTKYILPYRVNGEPLEFHKRKELYEKYSWIYDSIETQPLEKIIGKIYNDLSLDGGQSLLRRLDGLLSLSQIEKLGFGRCDDIVNYFVMLFRSLGFAAGKDYIDHWGNFYHSSGHAWVFLKVKKKNLPIQVSVDDYSNSTSNKIFKVGSMPKIFRSEFIKVGFNANGHFRENDVTNLYRPTSDTKIKNKLLPNIYENFKLCVYDNKKQWAVVDSNYSYKNGVVTFKNVGRGVLYSVAVGDDSNLQLINHPFYLDFSGEIKMLDNSEKLKSVSVTRKYPPFFPHINVKIDRLKTLNHCRIHASNTLNNEDFKEIYDIEDFCTTQKVKFFFDGIKKFRYYRLYSDNNINIQLASFNLLDGNGSPFDYLDPAYNGLETSDRLFRVLDDDPLSYIEYKNLNIVFEVPEEQEVSGFEIQARNDDNHINIGEEYELLQYDNGWKSINKEIAKDTILRYKTLPKNGLYLLKNLTKGKEENVFTFNEDGTQFWFGVSDIEELMD